MYGIPSRCPYLALPHNDQKRAHFWRTRHVVLCQQIGGLDHYGSSVILLDEARDMRSLTMRHVRVKAAHLRCGPGCCRASTRSWISASSSRLATRLAWLLRLAGRGKL